jgi:hypothetical protein
MKREEVMNMRHRATKKRIQLAKIKRLKVGAIMPKGDGAPSYQRAIKVVTETGTVELQLSGGKRETTSFAADLQIAKDWLPPEGITLPAKEWIERVPLPCTRDIMY